MDRSHSFYLEELPNLSKATNLESLDLSYCKSLVKIPSSFSQFQKLKRLDMSYCIDLQGIPVHMNLASLEFFYMVGCSRLRNIPLLSTNIRQFSLTVEYVPSPIRLCSYLMHIDLSGSGKLKGLTHLPKSLRTLDLSCYDIERIPDCIKDLHQLESLILVDCKRLVSLPELPCSLYSLYAENCESLETVFFYLSTPNGYFNFTNCFKLSQQARRAIIRGSFCYNNHTLLPECVNNTFLPGGEVPLELDNRARGSTLTIGLDCTISYSGFFFCLVISPNQQDHGYYDVSWLRIIAQDDGYPIEGFVTLANINYFLTEHLLIFHYRFPEFYRPKMNREMKFEFSSDSCYSKIVECGAKILTQEDNINWSYEECGLDQVFEDDTKRSDHADCWNWLFLCFDLSLFVKKLCLWKKTMVESDTEDISIPRLGH